MANSVGFAEPSTQRADGYFEGVLEFVASSYRADGSADSREPLRILTSANRMLFPSLEASEPFANNAPPGVESMLVRNDKRDMILYGDGYDAYQFKGYDLTLLGLAFKALAMGGIPSDLEAPEYVGRFALRGFQTRLWRYRDESGLRVDVCFSDDFRVNWGVLSESWLFGSGGLKVDSLDRFLAQGQVPVRLEVFSGELRRMSLNLLKVEEVGVAASTLEIPHPKVLRSSTRLLIDLVRN
tara:strand:- start:136 stop:855 length:720 start_codon:yes stop_codon:yes gene_type:complete